MINVKDDEEKETGGGEENHFVEIQRNAPEVCIVPSVTIVSKGKAFGNVIETSAGVHRPMD